MVRLDAVDDVSVLPVFFGEVHADLNVRALHLVIDSLADIVQQSAALGEVYIHAQFRRHDAGKVGNLDGMFQHVLPVAGAEFQPSQQFDEFGVQAEDAAFEHRALSRVFDLLVEFLSNLLHRLLDAGGVDSAVLNELFERHAGDLPSHGVKTRADHHFGGIVYDEFDPRRVLQRADVSSLPADDARLHIVAGQGDDGYGDLGSLLGGALLDREADDLLRLAPGFFLRLRFDVPHQPDGLFARVLFDRRDQLALCLFPAHLRDLFDLDEHLFVLLGDFLQFFLHLRVFLL